MLNSEEKITYLKFMDEICTKFKVNSYSFLRISPPGKIQIQYVTKNRLLTPIF